MKHHRLRNTHVPSLVEHTQNKFRVMQHRGAFSWNMFCVCAISHETPSLTEHTCAISRGTSIEQVQSHVCHFSWNMFCVCAISHETPSLTEHTCAISRGTYTEQVPCDATPRCLLMEPWCLLMEHRGAFRRRIPSHHFFSFLSYVNQPHVRMFHGTHMNEPWHTYELAMSHI